MTVSKNFNRLHRDTLRSRRIQHRRRKIFLSTHPLRLRVNVRVPVQPADYGPRRLGVGGRNCVVQDVPQRRHLGTGHGASNVQGTEQSLAARVLCRATLSKHHQRRSQKGLPTQDAVSHEWCRVGALRPHRLGAEPEQTTAQTVKQARDCATSGAGDPLPECRAHAQGRFDRQDIGPEDNKAAGACGAALRRVPNLPWPNQAGREQWQIKACHWRG